MRTGRGLQGGRRGNIVAMLMAAVAMTGLVGAVGMQTVMGPITTASKVTHQNLAQNDLLMNAKVVVMNAATIPGAAGFGNGDSDGDGYVEPVPFIPTSESSCSIALPGEGGCLPPDIGAIQTDPWGSQYAYCVWDHGNPASSPNRIDGEDSTSGAVIAIVSAGPNGTFETSCSAYDGDPGTGDAAIDPEGIADDLVQIFTYAAAVADGLWELKTDEPTTATIGKDVEVDGAFRMGFAGEDAGEVGLAACTDVNHIGRMRFNPIDNAIEVCDHDGSAYGWKTLAAAGGGVPVGTISAFDGTSCPSGWEPVTELQGRMVMGAGGGYAVGDTGGAASVILTAAQMPAHTHSVDPPSTATTSVGNHTHSINPPAASTNSAGAHSHVLNTQFSEEGGSSPSDNPRAGMNSGGRYSVQQVGSTNTTGSHAHTVNIPAFNSSSGGAHSHSVNITAFNSGSAGSGQAHENRPPYRVYLYCIYMGGADGAVADSFNDLNDVDTTGTADNDVLVWNESTGQWLPEGHWVKDGTDLYYGDGNVGIGTINPGNKLHVVGDELSIAKFESSNPDFSLLNLYNNSLPDLEAGRGWAIGIKGSDVVAGSPLAGYPAGSFLIHQHGSGNGPRMVFTPDGNVGIGTTNPGHKLHVVGDELSIAKFESSNPDFSLLNLYNTSLPDLEAGRGWAIGIKGSDVVAGSPLAGYPAGSFLIHQHGTLPRMVFTPDGNVGIGATDPQRKLHVAGAESILKLQDTSANGAATVTYVEFSSADNTRIGFIGDGGGNSHIYIQSDFGNVVASGVGGGCYINTGGCTSDLRLKQDIEPVTNALAKLVKLNGISFEWKAHPGQKYLGVIAQEVEKHFPDLVTEDREGIKSVNYNGLSAPMIEAIKELKAANDILSARIEALEAAQSP